MSDIPTNPFEELKKKGEEIRKRRESEVVSCPECGTEVLKDTIEEAVATAEEHDEKRHDGEHVSRVNGVPVPGDEVVEAAQNVVEKLGLGENDER